MTLFGVEVRHLPTSVPSGMSVEYLNLKFSRSHIESDGFAHNLNLFLSKNEIGYRGNFQKIKSGKGEEHDFADFRDTDGTYGRKGTCLINVSKLENNNSILLSETAPPC